MSKMFCCLKLIILTNKINLELLLFFKQQIKKENNNTVQKLLLNIDCFK